jgi:preprotein translocase subunit SecG
MPLGSARHGWGIGLHNTIWILLVAWIACFLTLAATLAIRRRTGWWGEA